MFRGRKTSLPKTLTEHKKRSRKMLEYQRDREVLCTAETKEEQNKQYTIDTVFKTYSITFVSCGTVGRKRMITLPMGCALVKQHRAGTISCRRGY